MARLPGHGARSSSLILEALEASDRVGRIATVDRVCSRPRLLPCCCDQHGLVAAHPENRLCETMAQHPELIWIKTVHVLACVEIKILRRVRVVLHAIDATPAGWRSGCRFLTAQRTQHGRVIAEK